jgi:hypothetical protein
VSVEFAPPQDLTLALADGRFRQIGQTQKVLGQVRHHDPDSLVLVVSAVYTDRGWERFTDATVRLAPSPAEGVTVLSTRPATTNILGAVALPALIVIPAVILLLLIGRDGFT